MRKILFLMLATLAITGCGGSGDPVEEETKTQPKEYTVSFGFAGEITNIEDSPLTKAESGNMYGIQVYSMPTNGTEYKPYAYGIFDNVSGITIKLLEGYKYKFACTMVVDGKNKLYTTADNGYYFPFYATDSRTYIGQSFIYSTNKSLTYIDRGEAGLSIDGVYTIPQRPNVDRYYGETADYIPSSNTSVSISMKRVTFGAKIIADGLSEGKIIITLEKAPTIFIECPSAEVQSIFTLAGSNPYGLTWTQDTYIETIPVSISWKKADGAIVPLVTQDITFTRNKLTTITVKVKDSSVNNGVSVSQESASMGDGGSVTIDASNNTDTPINPS